MTDFNTHLTNTGEVGYVEQVLDSIIYSSGLPSVRPEEVVIFETGETGQVLSLSESLAEVLLFSHNSIRVGVRATGTRLVLQIPTGMEYLGRTIDPLGRLLETTTVFKKPEQTRPVNITPAGIDKRKRITKPFETGIALVDMIVPLGRGQRELVIGDRKTGKSYFVLQTILTQARQNTICIYAAIGKKKQDIKLVEEFFKKMGISEKTIIIATGPEDPAGLIHLAPYSAMTIAEYLRDEGHDVLLVLDDMTTHAKFYREISLLGKKFPGRNSYPGDIFYIQAKLMERAGNFITKNGENSITCLPIVETTEGDLSGYIQTNIMSMTDGHIYLDNDLFYKGRRPAINMFLSVTRVGRQTQTNLKREINRELVSFMTLYEKLQTFSHFGAETTKSTQLTLQTGKRVTNFFQQESYDVIPLNLQIFLFCMLWTSMWFDKTPEETNEILKKIVAYYQRNTQFAKEVDNMIQTETAFNKLLNTIRLKGPEIIKPIGA